jgi:hypothetical protein
MRFFIWLRRLAWPCRHPDSGFRVAHTYCPGHENCIRCRGDEEQLG